MPPTQTRGIAVSSTWVAIGRSAASSSWEAGRDAARLILRHGRPELLLCFASNRHDADELLAGIAAVAGPDVPLAGCTTGGEITPEGPGSGGVVLVGLGGECRAAVAAADSAGGPREAGRRAVQDARVRAYPGGREIVLLLTDPLAGDQQEIVRGAYGVLGAGVPLAGGCAGDDMRMERTLQFCGREVLSEAVVAVSVSCSAAFGIGCRHGWSRVGEPMTVTRSHDGLVFSLDSQPALDTYLERLHAPAAAWTDPAAFTDFVMGHPLSVASHTGQDLIRCITRVDFEERSIGAIADIPEGCLTWCLQGGKQSAVEAAALATRDAIAQLDGRPAQAVVVFDCLGRHRVLGAEGLRDEFAVIADAAQGAPVAGLYTHGEIARVDGTRGFHNQTVVVLAIG